MADFAAYRDLVEDISGFPLDTTSIRKVGTYLLLPSLSWVMSAWAQQAVERWLRG